MTSAPRGDTAEAPRPRILFITHLDVWLLTATEGVSGAGNQSLYNTLLGYVAAGYDVHLLTSSAALGGLTQVGDHITIHRRRVPFLDWVQRLRAWRAARRSNGDAAITRTPNTAPARNDPSREGSVLASGESVRFWAAFQLMALWHGWRLARRHRYSIFYGYEVRGAPAAFLIGRLRRRPVVTRFQGTELSGLIPRPVELLRQFWTFVLAYALPADLVVMADDGTQGDRMLRFVGQPARRCGFWMNGVDRERVARPGVDAAAVRRGLEIPDDHAMILTTCRLVGWKRVDRALEALGRIRPETPRFVYVVVGAGPVQAELQSRAARLGLSAQVRFTGSLPHDRTMDYLNACDIYLSTYDLSNLGNPLIEATVCGRCIVTLDNGDTRRLIEPDQTGCLLPPEDGAALAAALRRLIGDPSERARLGAAAAKRGARLATWSQRMEQEIAALRRLTRGRAMETLSTR